MRPYGAYGYVNPWTACRPLFRVILPNSVGLHLGANYVRVFEVRPTVSATECSPKNLLVHNVWFIVTVSELTEREWVKWRSATLRNIARHVSNSRILVSSLMSRGPSWLQRQFLSASYNWASILRCIEYRNRQNSISVASPERWAGRAAGGGGRCAVWWKVHYWSTGFSRWNGIQRGRAGLARLGSACRCMIDIVISISQHWLSAKVNIPRSHSRTGWEGPTDEKAEEFYLSRCFELFS